MNRRFCFSIVAALIFLLPMIAQAAPVGTFTSVKGAVDVTSAAGVSQAARVGSPVSTGDVVRTKSRSTAEVVFDDGSILRLARNSRIAIDQYSMGKGQDRGILKLFRGKVQSIVKRATGFFGNKKKNRFEIHTPTAVCGVRGTNFFTWYSEGQSGSAVKEGTVYAYSAGAPDQVRDVEAGQSMIVVSEEAPPVVRPATDQDLTLGGDEEGDEPFAFVDEDQAAGGDNPGETPGGTPGVDDGETDYIPATPPVETGTLFEALLAPGFVDGAMTGEIDDATNAGTVSISGTFTGDTGFPQGQDLAGAMDDGSEFAGLLGGVTGSWEGIFTSIYVTNAGGAGYLYGTLSGDLADGTLAAEGPVGRSGIYGQVIQPAEGDYNLTEELTTWNLPLPTLDGSDPMTDSTIAGIELDGGRRMGVWGVGATGGVAPADFTAGAYASFGQNEGSSYGGGMLPGFVPMDIGYGGSASSYYMAGYLKGEADGAGHVKITDDGTIAYMDDTYLGAINLWYRGTDDGETYNSIAAGTYTLDPLAHVSETEGYVGHAVNRVEGRLYYTGSGYANYSYNYNTDNSMGRVNYYSSGSGDLAYGNYYIEYSADGTYSGYDYGKSEPISGIWSGNLADLVKNVPEEYRFPEGMYSESESTYQAFQTTAYLNGLFGGVDSLWTGADRQVTAVGAYQTSAGGIQSTWGSEIESYDPSTGQYTTYADENGNVGAYEGWMAGIKQESALSGQVLALYLAPGGSAGILSGDDLAGFMNDADAYWMTGTVNRTPKANLAEMTAEEFENSLYHGYGSMRLDGILGDTGTVVSGYGGMAPRMSDMGSIGYGGSGFNTLAINGEDWGIYSASVYGEFTNPDEATTWTSNVGGSGAFGSYLVEESGYDRASMVSSYGGYYTSNDGYWIGDTRSTWKDGKLEAGLTGTVLTEKWLGTLSGDVLGTYSDAGLWEAVSLGTWESVTALDFGAAWGDGGGCLQYNDEGDYSYDGWAEGRLGLIADNNGGYDLIGLGDYSRYNDEDRPHLWWPKIQSGCIDEVGNGNTQLFGVTGTVWKDGDIFGDAVALWVAADGKTAGLLTGGVSGSYEDASNGYGGFWTVPLDENKLTPSGDTLAVSIPDDPAYGGYVISPKWAPFEGDLAGTYVNGDPMSASASSSKLLLVTEKVPGECDSEFISHPLGAYWLKLESESSELALPAGPTQWSAVVGGGGPFTQFRGTCLRSTPGYWLAGIQGEWADGLITGAIVDDDSDDDLFARYLTPVHYGTLDGNFLGIYDEDGWIAESVGTFQGEELAFVSDINDLGGNLTGLIGGVDTLWGESAFDSGFGLTAMGEYSGPDGGLIWYNDQFQSRNYLEDDDTTYDGGAYYGVLGGRKTGEALEGLMVALYRDNADDIGFLVSRDLDGTVYGDIDMFGMDGTVARISMGSTSGFTADALSDNIVSDELDPELFTGEFDGGAGIVFSGGQGGTINIENQSWGIWHAAIGGGIDAGDGGETSGNWWMALDSGLTTNTNLDVKFLVNGSPLDGDKMQGDASGAWVNWADATTGVLGGELKGVFDAENATWQAVAAGGMIETSRFLDMVANNKAALEALNIPSFSVGSVDLTGAADGIAVSMLNTVFFAHASGGTPRIWANGAITGTNLDDGSRLGTVALGNGGSVTANFNMTTYDTTGNTWGATVTDGAGMVGNYDVDFNGAAAGQVSATDNTAFAGTGAGVVTNATAVPQPGSTP